MAECRLVEDNSTPAIGQNIGPSIIVQSGAFSQGLGHLTEEYKSVTKESAKIGYGILMNGGTPVDAVEAAVRVFEENENFNAGYGSYLNCEKEVECDAMIMDGETLKNGAVISGRHFRHPVSLCKKIMYESRHCALSGDGALKFAQDIGFRTYPPTQLISENALNIDDPDNKFSGYHHEGKPVIATTDTDTDTVSAVAIDANGHLACATSTGGIAGKAKGRVGDAPMIGCGAYANKTGAATITGFGESIMKLTLAREVVYSMENGKNAQDATRTALEKLYAFDGSHGGVIAIDKNGHIGHFFNTEKMAWASIKDHTLKSGFDITDEVEIEHL